MASSHTTLLASCILLLLLGFFSASSSSLSVVPKLSTESSWFFPGNPLPSPQSVVLSSNGYTRFTILTSSLIRLEYNDTDGGGPGFEDRQTMTMWNRALPPVDYSVDTLPNGGVVITTSALMLNYSGTGPFTSSTLSITLFKPSFMYPQGGHVWTPAETVGTDPGQLFGTFHTLDGVDGSHPGGLNCSQLDPLSNSNLLSYFPCDFGLVSQSGWSLVDESRRPVIINDFPAPRTAGSCDLRNETALDRVPCFEGGWVDTSTQEACEASSCCWDPLPSVLNLYYSKQRQDHFSATVCDGCDGYGYVFERQQGWIFPDNSSDSRLIPLNLYWNSNPTPANSTTTNKSATTTNTLGGPNGDNVVSTIPPTQPGYSYISIVGYIYDIHAPQPPATTTVKLWYSAAALDHFTTASPADEAEATAGNFTLVASLGYMPFPNTSYPNTTNAPFCYQRTFNQDWYFFGHGADYASAFTDFASIAGPIPIPRRHWLGFSWSRWDEDCTQDQIMNQISSLTTAGFPLSTYIFDMNWHLQPGWTGYTWDVTHYPNVSQMLDTIRAMDIPMAVNLHDADGIGSFEAQYVAMATAMGFDPSTNDTVQFHISNRTFADALQNVMLEPLAYHGTGDKEGVDFWWTDFQQGLPGVQDIPAITPTMILNHYRFQNYTQPGSPVRGVTHSRYGGLGAHRYPSLFGGDVAQTWASLQFMVYFTVTGGNVLAAYWGHEMMRQGGGPTIGTELFVRVMQFGVWSPIFTSWGNVDMDNNIWNMTQPELNYTQRALADRAQFIPYRYTLAKIAYDTAMPILRPMYYTWPYIQDAYSAPQQYYLGDDILVAPIYQPVDNQTNLASISIWFPPSAVEAAAWVDFNNASNIYGGEGGASGTWQTFLYPLAITPVFIRMGAVIPLTPYAEAIAPGAAARDYTSIQWVWYAGWGNNPSSSSPPLPTNLPYSGSAWVYEDDGISNDYANNVQNIANTTITYTVYSSGSSSRLANTKTIAPTHTASTCATFSLSMSGGYPKLPSTRTYSVWMVGVPTPSQVTVDDTAVPESSNGDGVPGTWFMDTSARSGGSSLRVYLQSAPTLQAHTVTACW